MRELDKKITIEKRARVSSIIVACPKTNGRNPDCAFCDLRQKINGDFDKADNYIKTLAPCVVNGILKHHNECTNKEI